jgi:Alpha galactosidase C-terminal beta sandwich domain
MTQSGILMNKNVIAVNQDPLMVSITRDVKNLDEGYQVWSGPLADGSTVILVLNTLRKANEVLINLRKTKAPVHQQYSAHDLWTDVVEDFGTEFSKVIPAGGTYMAKLVPILFSTNVSENESFVHGEADL